MIFRPVLVCRSSVRICSVSDTLHRQSSTPRPVRLSPRGLWYRVQIGASCPASGRVSCLAWSALVLAPPWFWHGLRYCLCCAVVPGALGAGVSTGGAYSRRPAPPGQSFDHRKNKKGSKNTPPPLPISKISRKNKKTPTKGLRSVLYLPYKP
nr:MAG TPA: hypothetical protein [Caudoviricetes sp.]